jgi:ATP-dependent DNA ligase
MEAELVDEIPEGDDWSYEPKWDGFRCLAFFDGRTVVLQSKSGQPLGRYFPELVDALAAIHAPRFVLDGEIVVIRDGRLSFDDLLQRIHPAESRIRMLAQKTPVNYLVFDLLVDARKNNLVELPLRRRRERLEAFFEKTRPGEDVRLSPVAEDRDQAVRWMTDLASSGFDGVVAKRLEADYRSGDRTGMVKIKRARTADCVVGGFRYDLHGREVGSLLLGLYNEQGLLDHVGFTSSFTERDRKALKDVVLPLRGPPGFTGKAPGGPSRWSTKRSTEWESLKPGLVCEVKYDHFSGGRFRHGTKFLRWRPDKSPDACTLDQLER